MITNRIIALLQRYWWAGILGLLLGAGLAYAYSSITLHTTYKGILFVTVGIDESKFPNKLNTDYYGITNGADNFTATVMGWFRSPELTQSILTASTLQEGEYLTGGFAVSKQEMQNIIVDFSTNSSTATDSALQGLQNTLAQRLDAFNTNNNSGFTFTMIPSKEVITPSPFRSVGLGALLGLVLAFTLCYLSEVVRRVIQDPLHAQHLLGYPPHLFLRNEGDIPTLTTYINNTTKQAILAGASGQIKPYLLPMVRHLSKVLHQNVILMDANLSSRNLHTHLGFGQSMKGAKGITDFGSIEETNNFFVLDKTGKTSLQFIPAGAGEGIDPQFIASLNTLSDITLFVTTLPESPEILSLSQSLLVLFIKPGVTPLKSITEVQLLFKGPILAVYM